MRWNGEPHRQRLDSESARIHADDVPGSRQTHEGAGRLLAVRGMGRQEVEDASSGSVPYLRPLGDLGAEAQVRGGPAVNRMNDLSIWDMCDDPDSVAAAIAAADQYRASLRDATDEKVEALASMETPYFARMLAVRELQRRREARR